MTTIYGIKNCDTVRKAKRWLEENHIDYQFHDFRQDGLDKQLLIPWVNAVGWETLLNTRGTTWRNLPTDVKENMCRENAIAIMLEHPAIIKRPVLCTPDGVYIGFKPDQYLRLFGI